MSLLPPVKIISVNDLKDGETVPVGTKVLSVDGVPICGAMRKNGAGRCRAAPMQNGRCWVHGGPTPVGVMNPNNLKKGGRHSRSLPERLAARYDEMCADPEMLNLQSEIALIDTRIWEILQRLDTSESGAAWKAVNSAFLELKSGLEADDDVIIRKALENLEACIEVGLGDQAVWAEAYTALDARRRLVDSEHRRLVNMNQIVTVEQSLTLVGAMVSIFKQYVTDPEALKKGRDEFAKLIDVHMNGRGV